MGKKLKIFGILTSVAGCIVGLISSMIDDKKMEAAVDEAVERKWLECEKSFAEEESVCEDEDESEED